MVMPVLLPDLMLVSAIDSKSEAKFALHCFIGTSLCLQLSKGETAYADDH